MESTKFDKFFGEVAPLINTFSESVLKLSIYFLVFSWNLSCNV